ncbi:Glu-tRNA(Gln) amidotransferase subunit GatE [Candidatus Woesearchaeota archaeon]|nr:Glu-tRNA(Gln) amidotransferase subunit GatE [Candidatus Woesearchaeota archaeon]
MNYKKLGLKCGLEIHAQLDGRKLFCNCPTLIKDTNPEYSVTRRQRAVVGETGKIDAAAAAEARKQKDYIYQCWDDCVCLIDLDEEPPRNMSNDALHAALLLGKMMNAKFVDEVQVMRKTIVDGSIPTGFQRTSLVAYNGSLDSSEGKISIPTILIEEDAARILNAETDKTFFALDRVGIPLIEISTGPDIVTPKHCAEVSEKIGLYLRSTGKCRRGLGTIRQDVNVSIKGGTRVEIKGAQDLKLIPVWIENEIDRQRALLEIKDELKKRGVKKQSPKIHNLNEKLRSTQSKVLLQAIKMGGAVLGIRLTGFAGLIGRNLQPNRRLGTEFSDRAKVFAGVGGLFHSDEMPNYGVSVNEVDLIRRHLDCGPEDAFILVADQEDRAEAAIAAVIDRANECLTGVPKEVRRPNADGTTAYLRPIPGAARMYPETDVLPVPLKGLIESIALPEMIDARIARYIKLGLGKDLAELAAKDEHFRLFELCVKKFRSIKPAFIAETIMSAARTIKRQFDIDINPSDEDFIALFDALHNEKISKESVLDILKENLPVKDVLLKYKTLSKKEIEAEVKVIIAANKSLPPKALMGQIMARLRGKASGKTIAEIVNKLTK